MRLTAVEDEVKVRECGYGYGKDFFCCMQGIFFSEMTLKTTGQAGELGGNFRSVCS